MPRLNIISCMLMLVWVYINFLFSKSSHHASLLSSGSSHFDGHMLLTDTVDSLCMLYKTIPMRSAISFREVSYAQVRVASFPYNDITLVLQMSLDKFSRLVKILGRWNGAISCAVYLPDELSIRQLFLAVKNQDQDFRDRVTLHVLLERPSPGSAYPVNRLRNLALDNIDTELFFFLDIDFIPSENIYEYLRDFFLLNTSEKRFSTLYVVPAFEISNTSNVPHSKEELLKMIALKKVDEGFHMDYWPPGHNSTDFSRWYNCNGGDTYQIDYQYFFEPYIAGYYHALHRFDRRLRGYGLNKWVWIAEAYFRGFTFEVLCGAFVVHLWHGFGGIRKTSGDVKELQKWYEGAYWSSRYNVTTQSLKKLKGK